MHSYISRIMSQLANYYFVTNRRSLINNWWDGYIKVLECENYGVSAVSCILIESQSKRYLET